MSSFDKVIGYDEIKKELLQVCDMIHNREVYEKLGAKMPSGILLEGEPGLGKTLMAKCFIDECGLNAYTIRKNKSGNFTEHISEVFEKAKANAPCIIFLDDMDKFANEDDNHRDADEYVAIQAGIDEVKNTGVFIIATVNEMFKLPDSLVRAGRFDRIIEIENPTYDDCEKIIKHYLKDKKLSNHFMMDDVPKMMNYSSCAELETMVNKAAIHAAYERKESIDTDDFVYAVLRHEYHSHDDCACLSKTEIKTRAIHEAGHALMCEILIPGSVGLVSIRKNKKSGECGFVHYCKDISDPEHHILVSLAGKAATETLFGRCDLGSEQDIKKVIKVIRDLIANIGISGFGMLDVSANPRFSDVSEIMNSRIEAVSQALLEKYMFKAKEIIVKNREFLEKIAQTLEKKETLLNSDIKKIHDSVKITEVAV